MKKVILASVIIFLFSLSARSQNGNEMVNNKEKQSYDSDKPDPAKDNPEFEVVKSDKEWRQILTPVQFQVLREKGTEYPFTGKYYLNKEKGVYVCAACGNELFSSDTKFDSGCGWPSFYKPIGDDKVGELEDTTHGMVRTEIICSKCGSHLGHVFPDGPNPTGLRYCINSVALDFKKKEKK